MPFGSSGSPCYSRIYSRIGSVCRFSVTLSRRLAGCRFGIDQAIIYDGAKLDQGDFMLLRIALLLILFAPASSVFAQWNQDAQDCFEETKPETFHPDKALPLCERAMNSGQLTPKNVGAMHYYRGTIRTYRKDHKGALEDYTEAIKLDPTLPQAYNSRGFSLFFLGDFQPAQKDFFYASE